MGGVLVGACHGLGRRLSPRINITVARQRKTARLNGLLIIL